MPRIRDLDASESAPKAIREFFKSFQKYSYDQLGNDHRVIDFKEGLRLEQKGRIQIAEHSPRYPLDAAVEHLTEQGDTACSLLAPDIKVYEVEDLPGLRLIPSLLSPEAQQNLLSTLLHDHLPNPQHKTNVHLHYKFPSHATLLEEKQPNTTEKRNSSFFHLSPDSTKPVFQPLDNLTHKPFTVAQFLGKKLRWLTLGGQYDWTGKEYPQDHQDPPFPEDIGNFISTLFPQIRPEAAILNVYRPGDILSVHRDVSEECDHALVSFSLGCDAIFVIGLHLEGNLNSGMAAIRVRSGDVVCLSGQARFAWHGVPRVFPGTCPDFLRNWPAQKEPNGLESGLSQPYEAWRGWMLNNRINLSVRQIRD